jgi:hypothetical protein
MDKLHRCLRLVAFVIVLCLIGGMVTAAEDKPERRKRGGMGIGIAAVSFDTNAKFTDKTTGNSLYVDAEGTLGLPERDSVPALFGVYRFSPKHALSFAYFQVRRENTVLDVDETYDDVRVQGNVTLSDRTRFYSLAYSYTFFENDRSSVLGQFGINGLDIKYTFTAAGSITIGSDTLAEMYEDEAGVVAPLPLFGLDFKFLLTRRWSIAVRIALVAGSYQDVSAAVFETGVRGNFQFTKTLGALVGVTYFDADVTIEDDFELTDINYGYNGAFFGLHISF